MEFRNSIPIYLQVMEDMKREMVTGGLPAGSRVESIRVLAARYGINLNTMQRVCAELERQGLLETKRGVGSFVTGDWERLSALREEMARALAETYLSDLVTSAKNGTMGNYDLSALVSLDEEDIKIDEIEAAMLQEVQSHALEQYGIQVHELRLKRVGLPATNVQSVFTQMQADRQKYIDQLLAEGERDAQIIMSESDAEVAAIVAEGREEAAAINAETEREVAEIYASAHSQDPELYEFLQKLAALENSVDEDTVMIITMDTPPFDVLYGDD